MVEAFGRLPDGYPAELLARSYTPLTLRDEIKRLGGWVRVCELGFLDRNDVREALSRVNAGLVLFHPEPPRRIPQQDV